ncbi:hypothetical protein C8R45DRAFT_1107357 [Mycena sanguinolenta]|nr:hypothetical protein C8R45DRAFT_1107357 [Mycena sanguinolenta]
MLVTQTCHARLGVREQRVVIDDGPLQMGTLYDITLSLIDRVMSGFCVRLSHDSDEGPSSDITLSVVYSQQCDMGTTRVVGIEFHSAEVRPKLTNLTFGDWIEVPQPPAEDSDGDSDEESD